MSPTLVRNYVHIIFSTKNREPFIKPVIQSELYAYLGEICRNNNCQPIKIGGYSDHIHILCLLSKKIPLYKLVEELKTHSSRWIKTKDIYLKDFYWQAGYGAFSVNPTDVEVARNYIESQKEIHLTKTFREEYMAFLGKYRIDYDERSIWE